MTAAAVRRYGRLMLGLASADLGAVLKETFVSLVVVLASECLELADLVRCRACAIANIDVEVTAEDADAPFQLGCFNLQPCGLDELGSCHVVAVVAQGTVNRVMLGVGVALAWLASLSQRCGDGVTYCACDRWWKGVADLPIPGGFPPCELPFMLASPALEASHHLAGQLRSDYERLSRLRRGVSHAESIDAELSPSPFGARGPEVGAAVLL